MYFFLNSGGLIRISYYRWCSNRGIQKKGKEVLEHLSNSIWHVFSPELSETLTVGGIGSYSRKFSSSFFVLYDKI